MNTYNDAYSQKRISWGSIIAGIFTVIAVHLTLMVLGAAVLTPQSNSNPDHIGTAFLVWIIIATLISLASGAFVAGRLAGNDGGIHGFLVWATSLITSTVLSLMFIGGVVQTVGDVVDSTASATGHMLSGVASTAGKSVTASAGLGHKLFDQMNINTNLNTDNVDPKVKSILQKSNIDTLQPDFLKQQLAETKNDLFQAMKDASFNPNNADAIVSQFIDKLKHRAQMISKPIDRAQVAQAISNNSDLSDKEANQAVDNYVTFYNNTMNQVKDRINNLQQHVQQAKQSYENFKKEAKQKADEVAKTMSHIALWGFFDLVIGAIISAIFGLWGARTRKNTAM